MTTLESTDLAQARQYFADTRDRVAEASTGLSEAQWRFKPAPDRWSIAEILEHMVIVQERVLARMRDELAQAPAPEADRDSQAIDAIIFEKIPDRSMKAKAPAVLDPAGLWTVANTLERLSRNYERLTAFLESTPELREHVLDSPPLRFLTNGAYDSMDGYQWVITVAAHDQRHLNQILEVKEDSNYPA